MTALVRLGRSGWAALLVMALLLGLIFKDGLGYLVQTWGVKDEYSYAYFIPLIAAFLVWQKRDVLGRTTFAGSWAGAVTVLLGLALFAVGELSTLFIIVQYAFLIALFGAVLAYTGWKPMATLWVALFLLLFMIPLPDFLYIQLSQKLQLISSELGVWVIRLFGISVFLEGNVIDLGSYQLQVVEACSGLRYLFPLMTLGFVAALFFRAPLWQRLTIVLSSVPITVLMNSFRIGVIGVLVDRYGPRQAEGFLHEFEGWVVFMACFTLLFVEMWLIVRLSGDKRPFREIFALELPPSLPKDQRSPPRPAPPQAWFAAVLLAAAVVPALMLPQRVEAVPVRPDFGTFPLTLEGWSGRREPLEQMYIDALKFTDYIMANYVRGGHEFVNFYVSYYDSQRKGESVHSPRVCLPGGGWVIEDFTQRTVPGVTAGAVPLRVNRVVMSLGSDRQLVYYWFQQRGRIITNEYLVKWFLFWDSLTRNRSDGSMVRLITPVSAGATTERADAVLANFASVLEPRLNRYLPD
jgi:exosortase D (VPLPA-CTERM-specific)